MTEHQRLFLVQAKTDYSVFNLRRKQPELPDCHLLHYMQMATELFGKAWAWKHGRDRPKLPDRQVDSSSGPTRPTVPTNPKRERGSFPILPQGLASILAHASG